MNRSRALLCCALSIFIAGCCGSNQAAIAKARALSQTRLARLVQDVELLARDVRFDEREIPVQFQDLEARSIMSSSAKVIFHLSGCVDDKVLLVVTPTEVALTLGEAKGRQVLYRSVAGAP